MAFEAESFLRDVLGARHVTTRGDELIHACLLPFGGHEHDDKMPGASLNADKLLYNCFKCGTGGTLLWATEEILGITSAQARKLIQGTFNADDISPDTFLQTIEQAWRANGQETMPHYDVKLLDAWRCPTKYLDDRGISREVQREMMTGLNRTNTDKVGDEVVTQPRIVIPHVFKGVLRGWSMRLIDKRQHGNKYKHSGQFPKSLTLYNYDIAKESNWVVVVESPFSVLKLMTYGIRNVVATFGAEVNDGQVDLLAKWDTVVLFPDGDKAGYRAMSRIDKRGNWAGLVHDLNGRTDVWVVDHGRSGRLIDGFNENDPADYDADEVAKLLEDRVSGSTWDYRFDEGAEIEKQRAKQKSESAFSIGTPGIAEAQAEWS